MTQEFSNGRFFTSKDMPKQDPNPFCVNLPFQLRIYDNSNLQVGMHCSRHWYYSVIRGLRQGAPAGMAVPGAIGRPDLIFGSLIHDGADIFNKALAKGIDAEDATALALGYVLEASWPEGQEHDVFGGRYVEVWQCQDRTKTNTKKGIQRCKWSKAEHLMHEIWPTAEKRCECGQEVDYRIAYHCDEKYKNRRTLARAMVALCDHLTAAPARPIILEDGRVGSELRWFQPLDLNSPDNVPYMMTGSFDGVQHDGIATSLREYKTTRRTPDEKYFQGLVGSPQVSTYTWAATRQFGRVRIHLIVIQLGVGFAEVFTKPVWLGPAALAEWQTEVEHYVAEYELRARLAAAHEAEGRDPSLAYPRRISACASLPGAPTTPCPFRDVCHSAPGDREGFLATAFHVEPWSGLGSKGVGEEDA